MDLLWLDFLNSDYHDWRGGDRSEDRLHNPNWWDSFFAKWHMTALTAAAPADVVAMKHLRTLLTRLATALIAAATPADDDLQALNHILTSGPVVRQVVQTGSQFELTLLPGQPGWPQVMADIAASFAETLTSGNWDRIRVCDNADCRWWFYDATRNRSKRFCDATMCGNLTKVRRFRQRLKESQEQA